MSAADNRREIHSLDPAPTARLFTYSPQRKLTSTSMEAPTFEPLVITGCVKGERASILIDPSQPWCTISEDFVILHSLEEHTRLRREDHATERVVGVSLSIPTNTGRYLSTWLMSTRSVMDHDVCLGANWINSSNIHVDGGSVLDPPSSDLGTMVSWHAESCVSKWTQSDEPTPASCCSDCLAANFTATSNEDDKVKMLVETIDHTPYEFEENTSSFYDDKLGASDMHREVYSLPACKIFLPSYCRHQPPGRPEIPDAPYVEALQMLTVCPKGNDGAKPSNPWVMSMDQLSGVMENLYAIIDARGDGQLLATALCFCVHTIYRCAFHAFEDCQVHTEKFIHLSTIHLNNSSRFLDCDKIGSPAPPISFSDYCILRSIVAGYTTFLNFPGNTYSTPEIAKRGIDACRRLNCLYAALRSGASFDAFPGLGSVRMNVELGRLACAFASFILAQHRAHYSRSNLSVTHEAVKLCQDVLSLPNVAGLPDRIRNFAVASLTELLGGVRRTVAEPDVLGQFVETSKEWLRLAEGNKISRVHHSLAQGSHAIWSDSGLAEDHATYIHHLRMMVERLPSHIPQTLFRLVLRGSQSPGYLITEAIATLRETVNQAGSNNSPAEIVVYLVLARLLWTRYHDGSKQARDETEALQLLDVFLSHPTILRNDSALAVLFFALAEKAAWLAAPEMAVHDPELSIAIMSEVVLNDHSWVSLRLEVMHYYLSKLRESGWECAMAMCRDGDAWLALLGLISHLMSQLLQHVELEDSFNDRRRILRWKQEEDFFESTICWAIIESCSSHYKVGSFYAPAGYALQFVETGLASFWSRAAQLSTLLTRFPSESGFVALDILEEAIMSTDQVSPDGIEDSPLWPAGVRDRLQSAGHIPKWTTRNCEAAYCNRVILCENYIASMESTLQYQEPYSRFIHLIVPRMWRMLNNIAGTNMAVALTSSSGGCLAFIMTGNSEFYAFLLPIDDGEVSKLSVKWNAHGANARLALTQGDCTETISPRAAGKKRRPQIDEPIEILSTLWDRVVLPIFDKCDIKPAESLKARPRIWWCTSRAFASLPLHAAGHYSETPVCCSDYAVSSYTPTLQALLHAHTTYRPIDRTQARILLGAAPRPFEGSPLPLTREELLKVASVVPSAQLLSLPKVDDVREDRQSGISVQTALSRLPEAHILHIACHGRADPVNPLQGGFLLRDGTLKVSQLLEMPLPNAFMAFLSACETAKGGEQLAMQSVHLAGTMMFAGFKSVVATLWPMNDADGPGVAKTIYARLFEGDGEFLDRNVVPYALDEAVRELRDNGLPAARWATYIHVGI